MKRSIYILISLLIAGNIMAQDREFTITGKLSDPLAEGSTVYLQGIKNLDQPKLDILDQTTVSNGQFTLKGQGEFPEIRLIKVEYKDVKKEISDFIIVEQESTNIIVNNEIQVVGSVINDEHQNLKAKQKEFIAKISALQKSIPQNPADEAYMQNLRTEMEALSNSFMDDVSNYIRTNIENNIGEFYFVIYANTLPLATLNELYSLTRPEFKIYENIRLLIDSKNVLTEGSAYLDVELYTSDGNKASLSDYIGKGKVVLIDFWASWCGPCRRDMPYFISLHNTYKGKDFEIVGISLDEDESSWIAAIKAMRMEWPQLSDLGGWNSIAANIYKISRIPQSFLVDKNGVIVGLDLRGEELTDRIDKLLEE